MMSKRMTVSSVPIRGNQRQSEAIRGNPRQSEAIRGNQWHSEAIRGTHLRGKLVECQSEAISGNPWQSVALTCEANSWSSRGVSSAPRKLITPLALRHCTAS